MPTNILSSLPLIALSIAMGVSGQTMIKLGTLSQLASRSCSAAPTRTALAVGASGADAE
jgi:hypothetical protein